MSRRKSWIAIVAIIVVATALAAIVVPQKAEAASLKGKLRSAKQALRNSTHRLQAAEAALAAAVATTTTTGATATDPAATPTPAATSDPAATPAAVPAAPAAPTVDQLKARVAKARRAVRLWKQRVHRIARRYRFQLKMARWEADRQWMPIIKVAAARYHVKADGMYRMMMRESGGQPNAGSSSSFKGLFQYCTGTWTASWNPWRGDSIYDGSSQIFATAYAINKGMGPSMWTTTYSSQY